MKKIKYIRLALVASVALALILAFGSCATYDGDCVHDDYEWVIDKEATCTEEGEKHSECKSCGETLQSAKIPITEHNFDGALCADCSWPRETSVGLQFTPVIVNSGGTLTTTCYVSGLGNCTDTEIVIPETSPDGTRVTAIGAYAFMGRTAITQVVIPAGVTSIGEQAFSGCTALADVRLPAGVTSIGHQAFYNCSSLADISLPAALTSLSNTAFSGSGAIVKEGGAHYVDSWIVGCDDGIRSVTVRQGTLGVASLVFYERFSLVEVINHSELPIYAGGDGYGYIAAYALDVHDGASKLSDVGGYLFYPLGEFNYLVGYKGGSKSPVLPESYNGASYEINQYAFYKTKGLISVTIPAGVTAIGASAFAGCEALIEVVNNSALNIVKGAEDNGAVAYNALEVHTGTAKGTVDQDGYLFYAANGVNYLLGYNGTATALNLPESFGGESYVINKYAFAGSHTEIGDYITSVTVPAGVSEIGYGAFEGCGMLVSVSIASSVLTVGEKAFSECTKLALLTLREGISVVGASAFYRCTSLTSLYIPDSVSTVGANAFRGCSALALVDLGDGVTSLGDYSFYECAMTSVTIPDSVVTLGSGAFAGCRSLVNATVGGGVRSFGATVFMGCSALTTVVIRDGVTAIGPSVFELCASLSSITIPDSVSAIGGCAFSGCESLEVLDLPASLAVIEDYAFAGCSGVVSIAVPQGVTSIGVCAFADCTKLAEITVPSSVVSIGRSAFSGCIVLSSVILSEGLDSIGATAFEHCVLLSEIIIPDSVTSLGSWAFRNCSSLTTVIVGANVSKIAVKTFYGCAALTTVTLGELVRKIEEDAFAGCTSLTEIALLDRVSTIENNAFAGCTALASISLGTRVASISATAFSGCTSLTSATFAKTTKWSADGVSIPQEEMADAALAAGHLLSGVDLARG